jgi:hypothetical protein
MFREKKKKKKNQQTLVKNIEKWENTLEKYDK